MIHFVMTEEKRCVLEDFLAFEGEGLVSRMTLVTWEELAEAEAMPGGTWILSDLDGLGPAGIELAKSVHRTLTEAGLRTLNRPGQTLVRLPLLQRLHQEGINGYRAVPATGDFSTLRYPVFVRGASDHFGSLGDLLQAPEDVGELLERAACVGLDLDDLIVVEFQDTARADGLHAKYGAFVVGDQVCPQHYLRGKPWMLKHNQSDFTEEIVEEEYRYVHENPHREALQRILRISSIEYGRVDYSVDQDGKLQVWEINLCPIVGETRSSSARACPPHLQAPRQRAKRTFKKEFTEAFESVDTEVETVPGSPATPDVPLNVPSDIRARALDELAPRTGGAGLIHLLRAKEYFGRRW